MKYITIPKPVHVGEATIPFEQLLTEQCWADPYWREVNGTDRSKMLFRLVAKFDGRQPDDVVELDGDEFEAMMPLVTMRGKQLPPHLALPLQRLMQCMFEATSDKPATLTADSN